MNMIKPFSNISNKILVLCLFLNSFPVFWSCTNENHSDHNSDKDVIEEEHEEHHEEGGREFGPDKGVLEYEPARGIVLGDLATKRLQIKLTPIAKLRSQDKNWILPKGSLIEDGYEKGIYIKKGSWYTYTPVKLVSRSRNTVEVKINVKLKASQSIVSHSVALLRLAELNAAGASGEGHGH